MLISLLFLGGGERSCWACANLLLWLINTGFFWDLSTKKGVDGAFRLAVLLECGMLWEIVKGENLMFTKALKAGALFFAVGVVLALAAPLAAGVLGADILGQAAFERALETPVMWTGVFFGMFGAIESVARPMFNKVFGKISRLKFRR